MALARVVSLPARCRPWRMSGTAMRPNVLLMCKLLALLLVVNGFAGAIDEPFLPYWPALDALRTPSGAGGWLARLVFLGAALALLANVAVRAASVVLGVVVIGSLLGSMPLFRNHLFICGCLFLLAGLHRRDESPWLLHAQLSVVYFGAFMNKAADPDWWDGRFMHHWLFTARGEPLYAAMLASIPAPAVLLSWTAIATELLVALLVVFRRTQAAGALLILGFHGALFVLLRGERFGHFLEDIVIALLMFVPWPLGVIEVEAGPRARRWLAPLVRALDWDRRIRVRPDAGSGVRLSADGREWRGLPALRRIAGFSAGFYVLLFVVWVLAVRLLYPRQAYFLLSGLAVGLALFFLPPVRVLQRGTTST